MKKSLLVFLMSFALLFCLVGCGNDDMNNSGDNNSMLGDMNMSGNETSSETDDNKNNNKTEQTSDKITSDAKSKAKATALKHAGLKEADIYDFDIDLDREDGKTVYEIDFKSGGYEYSYKINADTGKIIYSEKERD